MKANELLPVSLRKETGANLQYMTTTESILGTVKAVFNVTDDDLKSCRKFRNIMEARLAACFLLSTEHNMHPQAIGPMLGHTRQWAYWARSRCEDLCVVDRYFKRRIDSAYTMLARAA